MMIKRKKMMFKEISSMIKTKKEISNLTNKKDSKVQERNRLRMITMMTTTMKMMRTMTKETLRKTKMMTKKRRLPNHKRKSREIDINLALLLILSTYNLIQMCLIQFYTYVETLLYFYMIYYNIRIPPLNPLIKLEVIIIVRTI